jgi:hypothetical protein
MASFLTWNSNFFTEASSELSTNMIAHINSSIIIHYNSCTTMSATFCTKHLKGKVFHVLNQAPCHEDVFREWRYSSTPWLLHPQGKSPWYPLDRRLGGPQSQSGHGAKEKNS